MTVTIVIKPKVHPIVIEIVMVARVATGERQGATVRRVLIRLVTNRNTNPKQDETVNLP